MINPLPVSLPLPDFRDPYFKRCVMGVIWPEWVEGIHGTPARMQSLEQAWNVAMPLPIPRFPRWLVLDTPESANDKIRDFLMKNPKSGVRFVITTHRNYNEPEYHRFFVRLPDGRGGKAMCTYVATESTKTLPGMEMGEDYGLAHVLKQAKAAEIEYYAHRIPEHLEK